MADTYVLVLSRYWTGKTGKQLRALGNEAQLLGLYLLTCQSATNLGLYSLPLATLCSELGLEAGRAVELLGKLAEIGFAHYDVESEEVFVVNMAEHQFGARMTRRDNKHIGICKRIPMLRKMVFFEQWYERYRKPFALPALDSEPEPDDDPAPKPTRRVHSVPKEQPSLLGDDDNAEIQLPVLTAELLAEGYNDYCAEAFGLPRVTLPLSGDRLRHAKVRVKEHPDDNWWGDVFRRVGRSSFLRGTAQRSNGWKANFDFLIKPGNAERISEGNYDDGQPESQAAR